MTRANFVYRTLLAIVLLTPLFIPARLVAATQTYHAPDLKRDIFGGQLTISVKRQQGVASALAELARNKVMADRKDDCMQTAARLLGIALRLDATNRAAQVLNAELVGRKAIKVDKAFKPNAAVATIHGIARLARDSKSPADHTLAAYLFTAVAMALGDDDADLQEAAKLQSGGAVVTWDWADSSSDSGTPSDAPASESTPAPADAGTSVSHDDNVKPSEGASVSEIRGLVVFQAADGRWHGKAIDLIATATKVKRTGIGITAVGAIGKEMQISFEEAKRLVRVRHPGASNLNIEVSFGDKYTDKDGGSAGGAFTMLMLSALGDFQINPDAAMTGDITVDSKIRQVGEVPAKVHGAALDHCKLVVVPTDNAVDFDDAMVEQGPAALWETQIFSVSTLDEAVTVMRADPDANLAEAIKLFGELKATYGSRPVAALSATPVREELARIVALAPNHVSAAGLLRLANGTGPTHLSLAATIDESLQATGLMRPGLAGKGYRPEFGAPDVVTGALANLQRIRRLADPTAAPVCGALVEYCHAYRDWAGAMGGSNAPARSRASDALVQRADAVISALNKVITDPAVIDKLLHS